MSDFTELLASVVDRTDGWAWLTRAAVRDHAKATDPIERAHYAERAAYFASHAPGEVAR